MHASCTPHVCGLRYMYVTCALLTSSLDAGGSHQNSSTSPAGPPAGPLLGRETLSPRLSHLSSPHAEKLSASLTLTLTLWPAFSSVDPMKCCSYVRLSAACSSVDSWQPLRGKQTRGPNTGEANLTEAAKCRYACNSYGLLHVRCVRMPPWLWL